MWHVVCSQVNRVDSRLFLVGSQIGNLTLDPFFGHNLCFRCPNEQCEPILDIYVPRAFQWYKERHKPLSFDPSKLVSEVLGVPRDSISQSGSCLGSVRVHSLTLSYTPASMWCDARASFWPEPLQPLCLGREPKARVATKDPTINTILIFNLQMTNKSMNNNYKSDGFEIQRSKDDLLRVLGESTWVFT